MQYTEQITALLRNYYNDKKFKRHDHAWHTNDGSLFLLALLADPNLSLIKDLPRLSDDLFFFPISAFNVSTNEKPLNNTSHQSTNLYMAIQW